MNRINDKLDFISNGIGVMFLFLLVATFLINAVTTPDARIESAAKNSYAYQTYLRDDAITVSSKNGVVTLTGTVSNESHRSMAKDIVENLPDVKSVKNRLGVKEARNPSESTTASL